MKEPMKENDWRTNEFLTEGLGDWDPRLDRRDFLKLSSAAIALSGLSACVKPPLEKIFAYASQPEDFVPGESQFFATHYCLGGRANGLLIETHEGRPTRVDGNPSHPANLGAASAIHQALVLSLYDPDRIQRVFHQHQPGSLSDFKESFKKELSRFEKNAGDGFAILSGVSSSDIIASQREQLQKKFPKMRWVEYEPLVFGHCEQAAQNVFGQWLVPIYDFKSAQMVVSLDADFISHPHSPLVYAKDFANNENLSLFAIESSASITGAKARQRIALAPSRLIESAKIIAHALLHASASSAANTTKENFALEENDFLQHLIYSAQKSEGPVIFLAGDHQSVEIHEICHRLNDRYAKKSVSYQRSTMPAVHSGIPGLVALTEQMLDNQINTLLILGGNPVYASPQSINFKSALQKVSFTAHLSNDENETSSEVQWVIPEAHPLECFSDARAFDGTLSFAQPMIAPMYSGISSSEMLHFILTGETKSSREILDLHYQKVWGMGFQEKIKHALKLGTVEGSSPHRIYPIVKTSASANPSKKNPRKNPASLDAIEISFREDRKVYDGRFANHPWLQEFPDPLTRITWGNALLLHPEEMKARLWTEGDVIEITSNHRQVLAPAFADPLQAKGSATIHLGYGRTHAGSTGSAIGFNAYSIWVGTTSQEVSLTKTAFKEELACTQTHHSMEGRDLIRKVTGAEKASHLEAATSLYEKTPITDGDYAWAMNIDLDRCTGCGACVVACQSENNIPVVGKAAVKVGREMHWIRVDRYFEADPSGEGKTLTHFQPVPCMHCEKAPCEPVCPTGATQHGNGGLNQMVYNRCVGTRYCSNNCPYKVRRFNFLTYNDKHSKLNAESKNPNVTVRTRGVMEKCTYCVQRISSARIESARTKKPISEGQVKTACQTTCPSGAIQFGNLNDPNSKVSILRSSNRNYGLLEALGTRPRTTYLAKVTPKEDA